MSCPFRNGCRYAEACKDHKWFCVWAYWAALAVGFGVITLIVWQAAQI